MAVPSVVSGLCFVPPDRMSTRESLSSPPSPLPFALLRPRSAVSLNGRRGVVVAETPGRWIVLLEARAESSRTKETEEEGQVRKAVPKARS